ncbi:MAG: hypothetical protein AB7V46_21250 [Thermomicrobiales bacterium]
MILGVAQEQHAERCRLFAQWKQLDWHILHDPINVLESAAVPIILALDEHGIVRLSGPNPQTFKADFLDQTFRDDAGNSTNMLSPEVPAPFDQLKAAAERENSATAWRQWADAVALWGGDSQLSNAVEGYRAAVRSNPSDAAAWFRLGVCLRLRYEVNPEAHDDFRQAVDAWCAAVDLDPNQYIWRRRIQQYGPRLAKPYPFYDRVPEAEAEIRARGETPVPLVVRPQGAEIAQPAGSFAVQSRAVQNPDPQKKINRDSGSVLCDVVVVPATVKPGGSARVHLRFRLAPLTTDHWNNESEPLRVWIDPSDGVVSSDQLIEATLPPTAVSREARVIEWEIQVDDDARGTIAVPVYALYHLCDESQGQCRLLRQDIRVEMKVE